LVTQIWDILAIVFWGADKSIAFVANVADTFVIVGVSGRIWIFIDFD
jgi:hypothetical protein